jgi:hypothetical protein
MATASDNIAGSVRLSVKCFNIQITGRRMACPKSRVRFAGVLSPGVKSGQKHGTKSDIAVNAAVKRDQKHEG